MKLRNNILEKEKLRLENMSKEELEIERLKEEIKNGLLEKDVIEKICRVSLAVLLVAIISTMMLLMFRVINFNFSKVPGALIMFMIIILLIFITRLVQFKNRDVVLNKFLDEVAEYSSTKNKK